MNHRKTLGSERREQIIDAAWDLFAERGYHATSVRDIADQLGITHPGLLYHFHSKEELLLAVLARHDECSYPHTTMTDEQAAENPRLVLCGIVSTIAYHDAEKPQLAQFCINIMAEATDVTHPAHEYFRQRYAERAQKLSTIVEHLSKQGHFKEPVTDAIGFCRRILAVWDGLKIQRLYAPEAVSLVAMMVAQINEYLVEPLDLAGVPE
ncbi:MAG: TetR/AcrR family transcriptional regulator [Propionibacteriaceae bacterium]